MDFFRASVVPECKNHRQIAATIAVTHFFT